MADDQITMTPEEIAALREERDRLLAERDAERARAQDEARRADGLYNQVASSSRTIAAAQTANLEAQEKQAAATVSAINTEMAALRKQLADFNAEGRFEEAAEVQEKMADAAARRQQATQAQAYFAQQKEQAAKQPVDPVDRFLAANPNFNDAEREWIKKNPRYATDEGFRNRVNQAHAEALAANVEPGTTDYFKKLEDAGYRRGAVTPVTAQPHQPAATPAQAETEPTDDDNPYSGASVETEPAQEVQPVQTTPARQPTRSAAAAPPSRRTPTAPARPGGETTKLSPDEAAAALAMSEYFPDEVQQEGEAGIYAHYLKLKNSPMAKRLKAEWAGV